MGWIKGRREEKVKSEARCEGPKVRGTGQGKVGPVETAAAGEGEILLRYARRRNSEVLLGAGCWVSASSRGAAGGPLPCLGEPLSDGNCCAGIPTPKPSKQSKRGSWHASPVGD